MIEAARPALLHAIFTAERGAAPRLAETEAGFVAVEVKDILPPALRPYETVQAEVLAAWQAEARRRSQEERAAGLLAATKGGKTLAEAASEAGVWFPRGRRHHPQPAAEPDRAAGIAGAIVRAEAEGGDHGADPGRLRRGELLEITQADPDADPATLGRIRDEVSQTMAQDLETQFMAALRAQADVRVNPAARRQPRPTLTDPTGATPMPLPEFAAFSAGLAAGQGQVLWRERVADLDTPVGVFLKLGAGRSRTASCWKASKAARRAAAIRQSAWSRT